MLNHIVIVDDSKAIREALKKFLVELGIEKIDDFSFSDNIFLIYTLKDLNQVLKEDPECIIVFHYNSSPKVINQLSGQIKSKFKASKTLILAKGLSAEKAQKHHASKYGANAYLKIPFDSAQLEQTITKLNHD